MADVTTGLSAEAVAKIINNKVDKQEGKGLSTEDYTTEEKTKLEGIDNGAQVNPTIDTVLDDTSNNPIANASVAAALAGKLDGVKVDGTEQTITDGYVNLQTKRGKYNIETNRFVTEEDLDRLECISYYGKYIEPDYDDIFIEWVGGKDGYYAVTGYETGYYIGSGKVIPFKYDGIYGENSVRAIGDSAFRNCYLANIILPNSIHTIGDNAFDGCSHLSSIIIPDSVLHIGSNVFDNMASGFKVYCGKGSAMATYCETNNIPYVTNVDSEDFDAKQDTLVSGTNIKTVNNESLLGSENIALMPKWRLIKDLTLDEEPSTATITINTDTNNNSFILERAKIYIFSPASDNTYLARIQVTSRYATGYSPSYAFVKVRDINPYYSYIEMVTNDNLPTYALYANRNYTNGHADSTDVRMDFSIYTTHKQIEGISIDMQADTQRLAAGTRIVVLGLDK